MKESVFEKFLFAAAAIAATCICGLVASVTLKQIPGLDPNNLPHRPLSQIDIQGHQPAGRAPAGDYCPGQYGYYLPSDNPNEIFLFCWGSRP